MNNMITSIGFDKLKFKLEELRLAKKQVLEEMAEAQDSCLSSDDDSEINDYKLRHSSIDKQIQEMITVIENSKIIDISNISTDKVRFGSVVTLIDTDTEETFEYRLVSIYEGDPKNKMISIASPIGKSLMGSVIGDVIDVSTPNGEKEYEVLNIESKSY